MRDDIVRAKRIVVKVGSSSLTTRAGGIDVDRVSNLVDAVVARKQSGTSVVLVSSGAIAAGLAPLGLKARPSDLATQQASASVGQSLLVAEYARAFGEARITVGQVLLTAQDLLRRAQYRNAQRGLNRLLELGVLPIVNENDTVATDEIRFGDNDRLAALVAQVIHADALLLLSDVDGLYDGPPDRPGTSMISQVRDFAELDQAEIGGTGAAGVGLGGMATKVDAARIATSAGIPTVVTSAAMAHRVIAGDEVGTYFHAASSRIPTRLLWLAHVTTPGGTITLDDGAVSAVVERRLSLLPAGITSVRGSFVAGDAVMLADQNGRDIARGIVNYDAEELPALIGRRTADLVAERGAGFDREVVHRDDMVIMGSSAAIAEVDKS
jgi:glutamate 5-kinase